MGKRRLRSLGYGVGHESTKYWPKTKIGKLSHVTSNLKTGTIASIYYFETTQLCTDSPCHKSFQILVYLIQINNHHLIFLKILII